jgi:hypothetical protein
MTTFRNPYKPCPTCLALRLANVARMRKVCKLLGDMRAEPPANGKTAPPVWLATYANTLSREAQSETERLAQLHRDAGRFMNGLADVMPLIMCVHSDLARYRDNGRVDPR